MSVRQMTDDADNRGVKVFEYNWFWNDQNDGVRVKLGKKSLLDHFDFWTVF